MGERTKKVKKHLMNVSQLSKERKASIQDYTHRPGDMLLFYVKPTGLARLNAS